MAGDTTTYRFAPTHALLASACEPTSRRPCRPAGGATEHDTPACVGGRR